MVLVLVLVVVMVLSFAIYSFSNLMVTEFAATAMGLTHLQRRELASSGIELAAFAIRQETQAGGQSDSAVSLRQPITLELQNGERGQHHLTA
jgi:type II secretory pathway component PulK